MKHYQAFNSLIWVCLFLISLAACNTGPKPAKHNVFSVTDTIKPPELIKAGNPDIHRLSDYPPPRTIDLSTIPAPVKIPADFFVTMQNFNTEHGLALSSIICGFKDKTGNLWFGTSGNGVSRFDGKRFTNYYSSHGLIHNLIRSIFEDSEGSIWFGTYGGVSIYNGFYFENLTVEHGLVDNNVNQILEDKSGNIWISTYDGLSRYNSNRKDESIPLFTNYTTDHGLPGNYIEGNLEDSKGNLWFATENGLCRYDAEAERNGGKPFEDFSKTLGLEDQRVYCLTEDDEGNIWFGTKEGLVRYDPAKEAKDEPAITIYTTANGLLSNRIRSIFADRRGSIWLGTKEGLSEFRKGDSTFVNYTTMQGLADNEITSITEDASGGLWIGTVGGGLSRYDGNGIVEFAANQGLSVKTVYAIVEDNDGNLWMGGNKGGISKIEFDRLDKKENILIAGNAGFLNFTTSHGFTDQNVMAMIIDKTGNLWIGSGDGLSKFDGRSVVIYNSNQGLIDNNVVSLKEDSKGNIWIGTFENGLSVFDGKTFTNYTTEQGLVHNTVWNIHEDNKGIIWLATRGGLSRFDGENFINFTTAQGLPDNKLSIVTEDKTGNLLIGSWGGGISIVRKNWVDSLNQKDVSQIEQNVFENFNTANGLPNDVVYGVLEDDDGNIIVGTSYGITILKGGLNADKEQIAKEGIESFNQQTGYPIKDVSNNYSMIVDGRGFVWAGTGDKLVRFDYTKVRRNTLAPNVFIKSVSINHEKISWHSLHRARAREGDILESPQSIPAFVHNELSVYGKRLSETERDTLINKFREIRFDSLSPFNAIPKNLVLPYSHNNISFDFVGIETGRPFLVQYQFMLEGNDKFWSAVSNNTIAEYNNLRQGSYTFKLRAKSPDGIWSEPISYGFKVTPPWWLTWWAIIIYLFLFFLVLYQLRRYEMKRILLINQLKFEKLTTDSLRNLDQLKSQFFANISHEFRTPLTLILGPVEQMLDSSPEPQKRKILMVMHNNAEKLLTLVNQLLELSKLESGNYTVKASNGDIVGFLKGLFMSFASKAEQKNITLSFDSDPLIESKQFKELFFFDRDILEKIINNLLSNAFKFTPENGRIELTACIKRTRGEGNMLEISLRDSGIGIPEEKLPYIFDRFYQVDSSSKRDYEGSGIGLAFVKELVRVHQGQIIAKSKPEKGTLFILRLPMGKGHFLTDQIFTEPEINTSKANGIPKILVQEPMEDLWEQSHHSSSAQPWILIVEDHADVRHYIRQNLEAHYRIDEASNALDGLNLASNTMPDLIISDIMMPGMDGFEFCSILKADIKTSHIPVILLTARAEDEDRLHGLETGADDYLTKPFNPKELLVRVNNLVENRRKLREKFSTNAIIKPGEISVTSRDQAFMEKLVNVVEDNISNEKYSIEDLSRDVGMSQSQLHRKLKALVNQTTNHFVRSIKMHRAKELLERDAGTIAEIAYMVGYEDPGYFTKSYKAFFGQLPSEVRKKTE